MSSLSSSSPLLTTHRLSLHSLLELPLLHQAVIGDASINDFCKILDAYKSCFTAKSLLVRKINETDVLGRTALHLAATLDRLGHGKALVQLGCCNVNLRDRESGWTALHRAVYQGNLRFALMLLQERSDLDIHIRDREGMSAFELASSTFEPKLKQLQTSSCRSKFYTWGSNLNYELAHGDQDTRTRPDFVDILGTERKSYQADSLNHGRVIEASLSKLHTCVLLDEDINNLLTAGFGRGGRLGSGNEATRFCLERVQGINEKVVHVAGAKDHSIIVTLSGSVWSFGSNSYGCGCNLFKDHHHFEPHLISANSIKRERITGCAASTFHSVIYNQEDVYTFGRDLGQLGYIVKEGEIQIYPRKMVLSQPGVIVSVCAIDDATIILRNSGDILIYSNHNYQRLALPLTLFTQPVMINRPSRFSSNYIAKIASDTTNNIVALSTWGDVYLLGTDQRSLKYTFRRVWTATNPGTEAMDAAVGIYGDLLLCTKAGQVYLGHSRSASKDYKFVLQVGVTRVHRVWASVGGSMALLQQEPFFGQAPHCQLLQEKVFAFYEESLGEGKTLHGDFRVFTNDKEFYVHKSLLQTRCQGLRVEDKKMLVLNASADSVKEAMQVLYSNLWENIKMSTLSLLNDWKVTESVYLENLRNVNNSAGADIKLILKDGYVSCHRFLLVTRSEFFRVFLRENSPWLQKRHPLEVNLSHMRKDVLWTALGCFYQNSLEYLNRLKKKSDFDFIEFFAEILSCANELMLLEVKNMCEWILSQQISFRYVSRLLEVADNYDASRLKQNCALYILYHFSLSFEMSKSWSFCVDFVEQTMRHQQRRVTQITMNPKKKPFKVNLKYIESLLRVPKKRVKRNSLVSTTTTINISTVDNNHTPLPIPTVEVPKPIIPSSSAERTKITSSLRKNEEMGQPLMLMDLVKVAPKVSQRERKRIPKRSTVVNTSNNLDASTSNWVKSPSPAKTTAKLSLSEIQSQQDRERKMMQDAKRSKSLIEIQTEEMVIQAWKEYYGQEWEPPAGWNM